MMDEKDELCKAAMELQSAEIEGILLDFRNLVGIIRAVNCLYVIATSGYFKYAIIKMFLQNMSL